MDDIQSWWEVPSIAHFCSLFRAAFNLLDFDIEELEEALLTDGTEDSGSSLLQELIVRLLCGCLGNNDISTFNYQMFLRRLFRQKCQEYGRDNPFNTDIDFQFLPLRTKVEILHALCDFRLDADDVQDLLKNLESDSLRVEPLGHDENHSAYWYFYGTRLYREDFPKAKKKAKEKRRRGKEEKRRKKRETESESEEKGTGVWQVVCFTEDDWDKVTQSFRDSTSKNERALFHTLAEDFLPEIPRLFAEKERLQRKRLLEYQPRRQSSRLEKLKQQKEEEEKLLQREEEERLRQEREKKERLQDSSKESRASRALLRSISRTNSECGSVSSIPDSLTDSKSNRSSTFVGRQTNNSLSSATGQIVIQGLRRKLRSSQVFKQTEEDLQTGMYKILEHIKNHDDAWPFADPVDEDYAPRYYSIIRQPMDLQRMEDKLDEGEYLTFADFKADFQLIVDNCKQYNGTDNEYTEMVANLQEAFQTAAERYLESDPSSDEEIAVEFPTSSESRSEPQRHKHHHHRHHHRARRKKEKSKHRSSHTGSSSQKTSVSSRVPCAPSPDSVHTSTARASSTEKEEPEPPDPEPSVHDTEAGAESEGSSTREDTANELKRPHSHNGSTKRRKKTGVIKNAAAIEALELATEQTLKDINKWLDDTPRFSEFSSASNSPSHLMSSEEYDTMGSRIESEYRRNFKMERDCKTIGPPGSRPNKDVMNKRRSTKDASKPNQRRREVQRTIERLQPGKSKGNLISNIQNANKSSEEGLSGCSGLLNKPKENRNSLLVKTDEATPKLSLGTVLTSDVLGFGHNFEESATDDRKCASPEGPTALSPKEVSPERTIQSPEIKKEEEPVVADEVKQEKATPNLSAWFKAFGAPKTTAVPKQKKIEVTEEAPRSPGPTDSVPSQDKNRQQMMEEKVEDSPSPSQPVPLAQRQRKMSTGSSMSERSSFSQDPMDPLDGYPAPYPSPLHRSPMAASPVMASPRPEDTPKPTASYPPLNGTIRVGFYQDTSSSLQKSSPEKSPQSPSPYQQPLYSPRYPPPPDYLSYRNQPPPAYDGLPVTAYGSVMQYYDTSKPLTDQYRAARTQSSEEFTSAGYSPPRPVVTSSPLPTPVNLERPSVVPATTSGLLSTLPFSSSQQQDFEITVPRPTLVQKPKPAPAHSSSDTIRPSTMFPVKKRLYSEVDTTQRVQPSAPSPPRRLPVSPDKVKSEPSTEKHSIQITERLYQNTGDPSRTAAGAAQSPPPIHNVGNDLSFRRGPFSPAAPTPIGNLANLSHIVDRFPEGAPFYASAGDKGLVAASHLFQPPVSSAAAAMVMFSQAASTIPYNRAVTELSSVLSGKAADVQSVYSRSVPELTSVLSGKSASSLSGFTHPTVDAANKATVSLETQPTYSLSSMLTTKVPSSASSTYSRSLESSTIVKPSRKRKLKTQSATTTSETSVPSSSISSTTAFQQYVSEPSAISLKTVPGSAFNFGPAPSGLGLYGDAAGFLDEYRTSAGGYYIPPGPAAESGREKQTSAPTAPSPFQFLGHPQPRPPPTYPQLAAQAFMNHQPGLMDAASAAAPLYQQYLQRHPEELLRAPVVLHQGLLAPPTGYPPGYHPALGIRQPFDALNRPSWL